VSPTKCGIWEGSDKHCIKLLFSVTIFYAFKNAAVIHLRIL
jgi:hypothetical protein